MEYLPRPHKVVGGGLKLSPQMFCSRIQLFQPCALPSHFCALSMLSAVLQINLNPSILSFKELSQFHSVFFFFFPFHAQHYQSFKPSLGRFTFQSPCSCSVGSCPAHLSTKCPEVTAICQMLFLHMATWEWLQDYWEAQGGGTDYTIIWVGSQVTVNLSTERESTLGKWKARGSRLGSRCGREHLCPSYLLASLSGSHRQHEINNCT